MRKTAIIFCIFLLVTIVRGNDSITIKKLYHKEMTRCLKNMGNNQSAKSSTDFKSLDTLNYNVESYEIDIPTTFAHMKANVINDPSNVLSPLFETLKKSKKQKNKTIEILHIGDSHVQGGFFTHKITWMLTARFPSIIYKVYGINGATCRKFLKKGCINKIAQFHPQCIICSFGTNEAHNHNFKSSNNLDEMEKLYTIIREHFPKIPIIITTPPGAFWRGYSKKRGTYYYPNTNTKKVTQNILLVAQKYNLATWDLFNVCGGDDYAPYNWERAGLIRKDHIHFEPQGYWLQGELFVDAFIKSYNLYVK